MSDLADGTIVDAHVHLYDCFDLQALLDAAHVHFEQAAATLGIRLATGVLLLAERAGERHFERLAEGKAPLRGPSGWCFQRTGEAESLTARSGNGMPLTIVCGRQIVTAEGLELLALATADSFAESKPIAATIEAAVGAGAIAVLPWAVGKWLGRRGRIVRGLIEQRGAAIAVGDNGNRPVFWPKPALLRRAERLELRVLPGSDPLPLPSEATRAGGFGFAIPGALSQSTPAADLKRRLADPGVTLTPYGRLELPLHFFKNQLALRRRSVPTCCTRSALHTRTENVGARDWPEG